MSQSCCMLHAASCSRCLLCAVTTPARSQSPAQCNGCVCCHPCLLWPGNMLRLGWVQTSLPATAGTMRHVRQAGHYMAPWAVAKLLCSSLQWTDALCWHLDRCWTASACQAARSSQSSICKPRHPNPSVTEVVRVADKQVLDACLDQAVQHAAAQEAAVDVAMPRGAPTRRSQQGHQWSAP